MKATLTSVRIESSFNPSPNSSLLYCMPHNAVTHSAGIHASPRTPCFIMKGRFVLATQEGYGVIVLNPNENSLEVEKVPDPAKKPSPDASDEPAEKRERKEERESKKKKDFYEKYRNPQKEREMEHIPIRSTRPPARRSGRARQLQALVALS
ncbi:Protein FAM172A [Anabarilius grahami]|uniref:Protein FAM172A n=1 Tax=Anabarilius grahami TaxID=495550 RepID=A0A3N0Y5A2_ANAGA|nr:Protein FAM172A [Anabarilius grahami]